MARPIQAAVTSSVSFMQDGLAPLLPTFLSPRASMIPVIAGISLIFLSALGSFAEYVGGASTFRGATRIAIWGTLAMGVTAAMGSFFDAVR